MTKEEIRTNILGLNSNCILAELPTGVGKTKLALDFIHEKQIKNKILIVIPRLVLIDNWKEEFNKWGYEEYLPLVTFTTYVSLPKYVNEKYDLVIFDECHHLSERARLACESLNFTYTLLLSATVKKEHKQNIKMLFPDIVCYKLSMRKAIEEEILPDPKVLLVPLTLDDNALTETIIINPNGVDCQTISFDGRFNARKQKKRKYKVICTQKQYYKDLSDTVEYYKRMYMSTNNKIYYFKWQQKAGERLKWLASLKNNAAKRILFALKNKRTLTFCSSVEQTEILGKYCINSKNEKSAKYLQDFNDGKIKHITACQILNEGVNLTNCQIGIFVSINSSEIMVKQKNGRILRHLKPIIIIMYYKDTREEVLVNNMLENYNSTLITSVSNIRELKNEIYNK